MFCVPLTLTPYFWVTDMYVMILIVSYFLDNFNVIFDVCNVNANVNYMDGLILTNDIRMISRPTSIISGMNTRSTSLRRITSRSIMRPISMTSRPSSKYRVLLV